MRKILLTGFFIALVASMGYASPVASANGADGIEWGDGAWEPTAADYIQDGLVCQYDGKENWGFGEFNPDATIWRDLVSGIGTPIHNSVTYEWTGQSLDIISGGTQYPLRSSVRRDDFENCTVQIVSACRGSNCPILSFWVTSSIQWFIMERTNGKLFLYFARGESLTPASTDFVTSHQIPATYWNLSVLFEPDRYTFKDPSCNWQYTVPHPSLPCRTPFGFGARQNYYTMNGEIFAIRIYDRLLSDKEIQHNYLIDRMRFDLP